MPQPIRKNIKAKPVKKKTAKGKRPHPKYGISKLEDRFAKEFLDKLGLEYERQYEAKDIKRFYDFAIKQSNGAIVLCEIDGDYYHGFDLVYEEKSPMQKRNERVDKLKDVWAAEHGIPLIRIWEHDINENPGKVMNILIKRIDTARKAKDKENEKKKRH